MKDNPVTLLALYPGPDQAVEVCRGLLRKGFLAEDLTIVSDTPFQEGVFPVAEPRSILHWITVTTGIFGIFMGILLTVGTSLLYPIQTGHMSILPIPPYAIIAYEMMMLFAIVSTVTGFVISTLHRRKGRINLADPLIQENHIGVLIFCRDETVRNRIGEILHSSNPIGIREAPGRHI